MAFIYYNANPKGVRTGDCVIRGISYFLGITWSGALHSLIDWGEERGLVLFHYRGFYNKFLADHGFQKKKTPNKDWTVNDFCEQYAQEGKCYLIQCPRHITVVHGKDIIDSWDCGHLKVEGFWER